MEETFIIRIRCSRNVFLYDSLPSVKDGLFAVPKIYETPCIICNFAFFARFWCMNRLNSIWSRIDL